MAGERSRAPLSERGRRTRAGLVAAARGFDATRMSDIAAAAGVSHGTVYTWFPTKEDVLHGVVDSITQQMYDVLSTPDVTDPVERIAIANARYLDVHRQTARLMEVVAQAAVNDESFRAVLTDLRHAHVDRVAKTIEKLQKDGIAPRTLDARLSAAALCSMVEGFARNWMTGEDGPMAPEVPVVRTLTELWARSLGLMTPGGK